MIRLVCLGSGSSGNTYLLETDTECLVLDCGVNSKETKIALDFNVSKIVGYCLTHAHADHFAYAKDYDKLGIPSLKPFVDGKMSAKFGGFNIKAFDLTDMSGKFVHTNGDGTECPCYGFYITHKDLGSFVYATDCEYIKYRFPGVNHFLIEANYSDKYVEDTSVNRNHVYKGHMSIQTACGFIQANNSDSLKTIILGHLSTKNAEPMEFIEEMRKVADKPVIHVAHKGLIIDLGGNSYE